MQKICNGIKDIIWHQCDYEMKMLTLLNYNKTCSKRNKDPTKKI